MNAMAAWLNKDWEQLEDMELYIFMLILKLPDTRINTIPIDIPPAQEVVIVVAIQAAKD